ncbi:MAG: hypothetical protein H6Q58_910 [Firmicutes bacterium]|nr:hypothetical protein [Bacillota bacterium]
MSFLTIRFYGGLNYFLPPQIRQIPFRHSFTGQPTVKDLVESFGVPHAEVDLILVDGVSARFDRQLRGGEKVSVYPAFRSIDVSAVTLVRPEPLTEIRFVLDVHLGKLASYLRMAGFDTLYSSSALDSELAERSALERRILLTFDRGLLKRKNVMYGYCVRSRDPATQLKEVLNHFGLSDSLHPFSRCMICNGVLQHVAKDEVFERLPEKVREYADDFTVCRGCGRIYWKGTHFERMSELIKKAISSE